MAAYSQLVPNIENNCQNINSINRGEEVSQMHAKNFMKTITSEEVLQSFGAK